jgi:hypothetical protein
MTRSVETVTNSDGERVTLEVQNLAVADKPSDHSAPKRSFAERWDFGRLLRDFTSLNKSPFLCSVNGGPVDMEREATKYNRSTYEAFS